MMPNVTKLSTLTPVGRRVCSNELLNESGGGQSAPLSNQDHRRQATSCAVRLPPKCFQGVCINARVIQPP
jgi:hypothetical protein